MPHRVHTARIIFIALCFSVLLPMAAGCGNQAGDEVLTVGIISHMPMPNPVLEGFLAGMKELGYSEADNLVIIYREISTVIENSIGDILTDLKSREMDLLLTFEHDITLNCKPLTEKMGIPVIFISSPNPVDTGLVEGLAAPGGNLTGIRMPETAFKTLEWISVTLPQAKTIYLPYNPSENTASTSIDDLRQTAVGRGLSLFVDEIQSAEETAAAIESLGKDIDAVLLLPSHALNHESALITRTATDLGIPTFASLLLDENVMLTFTGDFAFAGRQAARLAHQIDSGIRPSDLPIESSDAFLIINLKTAEKIGITIPEGILSLAKTLIR